jgi:hypothetical protein
LFDILHSIFQSFLEDKVHQPSTGGRSLLRRMAASVSRPSLMTGVLLFMPYYQGQDAAQYHSFDEMTAALRQVVRAHSDIARMESLGETSEGREIWMVEIANRNGVPVDERPGLLIVANLEGDHVVGSELALHTVEYLLANYGTDTDVKERVDNHVFYVFPRLNPDAAELMWADIKSSRKTNTRPNDDDNDGRTNEDGPEDLNRDGLITQMRVADPMGKYLAQPDEPRLMKEAEPAKGESGGYKVYWEGTDNDGDGFFNEDGPGGVDLNRNFQHAYPYYEPGAGPHMVSEPESRALMDFAVSHRNIAAVLTYGESDNLVTAPTSNGAVAPANSVALLDYADASNAAAGNVGMFRVVTPGRFGGFGFFVQQSAPAGQGGRRPPARRPATTVDGSDLAYYTAIGEKYGEITGVSRVAMTRAPQGSFFEYAYFQFGVPAFSTPGWGVSDVGEEEGETGPVGDQPPVGAQRPRGAPAGGGARPQGQGRPGGGASRGGGGGADRDILKWMDEQNVDGFVDWEEFQHPSLGVVEIGGFAPYAVTNPPPSELTSLGETHAQFAVYLASLFAEVRIADVQVTNHGGGVFEIKAEIENAGFLPTSTAQGVRSRSVAPTMVQLGVSPDDLLTGAAKTSFFQKLDGSGARESYTWIINGRDGATIDLMVRSQKGGSDSATITLR